VYLHKAYTQQRSISTAGPTHMRIDATATIVFEQMATSQIISKQSAGGLVSVPFVERDW
jgi:hypothetical protein